ncbi:threonine/homoserine/homoserine lactone efflux protein [Shewanella chilikensis]|jgi:threonine/homoserine/homoserine lactone efflux protein|uniref:Threonine/homoserine/homoserine lactone efflux protein n=1 Tax=Shewanella chilikensis TaxID=558541 RepID=A0ABX5PNN2_9GAMM|nr:LysE family translocator [Shewanella chilikensis]MCL1154478.1 LysE family translocator [Shewanella chilikensis]PYE58532.1 threonine/homoserine/homoserine lactone efflux protein [Shewanella chilikensis]GGZ30750.1 lysine transporter LysE [Shewanella chilikensis]
MTDLHLLLTLGTIHLLALASPGPDFALILKIASREQRSTALAAAIGISLAILVHTVLSLTGVSLAIQSSHTLFVLVQLFGALYLGWMGLGAFGVQAWLQRALATRSLVEAQANELPTSQSAINDTNAKRYEELNNRLDNDLGKSVSDNTMSATAGLLLGLSTNLFNPKALVFFLTLFSSLITPAVSNQTKLLAAILLPLLSVIWFAMLAMLLSHARVQQRLLRFGRYIDYLCGAIFLTVSVAILLRLLTA